MIYTEDPAISMARETLFANNQVYNSPEIMEDIIMPRVMTTKCIKCNKQIPLKGSCVIKTSSGKKEFYCDDCKPEKIDKISHKKITTESADKKKRTCFFCDNILFYINTNGSIECHQCRATFKKGELS